MESNPKITIIVPVYKVESFLSRCLDSIMNQTFYDWECILVDDGSPDKSGVICDEYAEIDARFKVLHVENGGVSKARNIGMRQARGEFVTFIDSDDFIDTKFIEALYEPCKKDKKIDFVHAGCVNYLEDGQITLNQAYENFIGDDKAMIFERFRGLIVSKLFCLDKIRAHNIRFDEEMKYGEDMVFTIDYLTYSKKYALIDSTAYFYVQRSDSAMHTLNNINYEMALHSFLHRYDSVKKYIEMNKVPEFYCRLRYEQTAYSLFWAISTLSMMDLPFSVKIFHIRKDFCAEHYNMVEHIALKIRYVPIYLCKNNCPILGMLLMIVLHKIRFVVKNIIRK